MATPQQLAKIHILLKDTGTTDHKASIINGITSGRSDSAKDLTGKEAGELITYLTTRLPSGAKNAQADRMKNKIIGLAHEMAWKKDNGKIDMNAVNTWCIKFGYLHKKLDAYTFEELPALVTQFEQGPYKHYLNNG